MARCKISKHIERHRARGLRDEARKLDDYDDDDDEEQAICVRGDPASWRPYRLWLERRRVISSGVMPACLPLGRSSVDGFELELGSLALTYRRMDAWHVCSAGPQRSAGSNHASSASGSTFLIEPARAGPLMVS